MAAHATLPRRSAVTSQQRPWAPLGLSFFAFILIGANDGALGVLLPGLIAHYSITKATASLIFPAGTVGYLLAALNSGLLLERLGRRAFLSAGAAAFVLGTTLAVAAPPFAPLLLAFLLIGFAIAVIDAGLNAYVAGLPQSAGLLNYLHAFYGGGALLGPLIASGVLALTGRWNATYLVWALAAALTLAGLRVVFAPPIAAPRQTAAAFTSEASGPAAVGNPLALALRSRVVWLAAAVLFLYVGAEVSLGSWSYTLLTEGRRVPPLQASWMVSGFWLGLVVGRLTLGRVAERKGVAWLVQACIAGVLVSVALVWVAPAVSVAALGLWLTGFSLGPIFPSTIALLDATVAPRLQQSAIGFAASLGAMGAASFPWLAGNLIERAGLWALLPFVASLTVVLLGLWLTLRPAVKGS